jgi:single-strand DNA-binding protein
MVVYFPTCNRNSFCSSSDYFHKSNPKERKTMARGLNEVRIIGNLGNEPEMRYTPTGRAVTTFRVAVNERWGDSEDQKHTEWFSCEAWGKTAEILNQYLKKGSSVYISGRQLTDSWEKDGSMHYRIKLVVKEFLFLGEPGNSGAVSGSEDEPANEENIEFGAD